MSVYFNGKKVSIASTTKIYGGEYNVTAEDKEDGTQKLIINTTPTNPAIVPTGIIDITENGQVDVTKYAFANVNVENSGNNPSGSINITTNGSHDVSQYAIAEVNVPIGTQGGRYYSMRRWWATTTSLTGTMTFPIENFKLVKIRNLYWRQGNNVLLPTRVETTLTSWDSIDLSIAKVGTILSYSTTDDPIFEYCPVSSVEKIDTNIVLTINNLKQGLIIINSGEDNYILLGFAGTENSAILNTTTETVDTYYVYGGYSVGCPINVIPSGSATQMYTGQSKEVLFDDDSRPGSDLQNASYLPFENGGLGSTTYGMHDNTVWGMFYEMRPLE